MVQGLRILLGPLEVGICRFRAKMSYRVSGYKAYRAEDVGLRVSRLRVRLRRALCRGEQLSKLNSGSAYA